MQVSKINTLNYMQKFNANNERRPRINSLPNNNQIVNNEVVISKNAFAALNFKGKMFNSPPTIKDIVLKTVDIKKAAEEIIKEGAGILKRIKAEDTQGLEITHINKSKSDLNEFYVILPVKRRFYFVNDKLRKYGENYNVSYDPVKIDVENAFDFRESGTLKEYEEKVTPNFRIRATFGGPNNEISKILEIMPQKTFRYEIVNGNIVEKTTFAKPSRQNLSALFLRIR